MKIRKTLVEIWNGDLWLLNVRQGVSVVLQVVLGPAEIDPAAVGM